LKIVSFGEYHVGDFAVVGHIYYRVQLDFALYLAKVIQFVQFFFFFSQFWAVPKKGFWCE